MAEALLRLILIVFGTLFLIVIAYLTYNLSTALFWWFIAFCAFLTLVIYVILKKIGGAKEKWDKRQELQEFVNQKLKDEFIKKENDSNQK